MENMSPNRPLTHDLFKNALDTFEIQLKEIVINNLLDGIFFAQLVCDHNGKEIKIDSRTSDAIAMAVRFGCSIFTFEFIMEAAGVILDDSENDKLMKSEVKTGSTKNNLENYSLKALEKMLDDVLQDEDYEKAAKIRDEINKRTS